MSGCGEIEQHPVGLGAVRGADNGFESNGIAFEHRLITLVEFADPRGPASLLDTGRVVAAPGTAPPEPPGHQDEDQEQRAENDRDYTAAGICSCLRHGSCGSNYHKECGKYYRKFSTSTRSCSCRSYCVYRSREPSGDKDRPQVLGRGSAPIIDTAPEFLRNAIEEILS